MYRMMQVKQMNKRQLEVQKNNLKEETEILKRLKLIYGQAQDDCVNKIIDLSRRKDMENLQSIIWQKQYQEALNKQLQGALEDLSTKSFTSIAEYLDTSYENGFLGTLYDLQGQGIPLCFPIDQEQVVKAVQVDSKLSQGLYKRMGEDTGKLKESIKTELSIGIANGESWNQIAAHIASGMKSPFTIAYNRAITIARTEGHRVNQEASLHCQQKAKYKGADIVKQWDATLDSVTRPHHLELDQQIREVEEPFEVAGMRAMYPGSFGTPSEDCNCRCCLLQRARWAVSEEEYYTKWDGNKNELVTIKAKSYNEFKEEYLKAVVKPDESGKITDTDKKAILDYMGAKSYVVNEKLREGSKLTKSEQEFVNKLDNALDKMPSYEGNLQRSLLFYSDEAVEEFMNNHKVDNVVTYQEFLSTTKGETYNPDGQVQIYIQGAKNGKDVSTINENENEILYKRNSSFKVENVVNQDGKYYILVVENNAE